VLVKEYSAFRDTTMFLHRLALSTLLDTASLISSAHAFGDLEPRGLEHPHANVSIAYPGMPVRVNETFHLGVANVQYGLGFQTQIEMSLKGPGAPPSGISIPVKCSAVKNSEDVPIYAQFQVNSTGMCVITFFPWLISLT
jgi:hypothetical protein